MVFDLWGLEGGFLEKKVRESLWERANLLSCATYYLGTCYVTQCILHWTDAGFVSVSLRTFAMADIDLGAERLPPSSRVQALHISAMALGLRVS
jgi:hypothetical protein